MKDIDQMITEQVRAWSRREAEARHKADGPWPVITISRQFGARGAQLASVLGKRLGFEVWDKALLNAVAEQSGGDVRLLKSLDEHHRKAIDDAVNGILRGSQHTNTQYFRALMRVVHTIAAHGKSIVVGRGANYICKSPSILRVRIVCPTEENVRGYAERMGLTPKEARKEIERMEAIRADFIHHHFRRDINNPADYDLVINAGSLDLEQMVELVLAAYAVKTGKDVSVG